MNVLVVLGLVAVLHGANTFVLQDTPTAAAEKAALLAELVKNGLDLGILYNPPDYVSIGTPIVTPNGFIADTPEVATAKAAHLAHVKLTSGFNYYPHGFLSVGTPVLTPSGYIADTREVAAAKAAHLAIKAQVEARALGLNSAPDYLKAYGLPPNVKTGFIWSSKYTGPIAVPVMTP